MECRSCGNKEKFQALVTDYRPTEIWVFQDGDMSRFTQPDSGDLEIKVTCLKCDSHDVDTQGFKLEGFAEKKMKELGEDEWDKLVSE